MHRVESRIQRNASYNRFFVGFFGVLATFIGYGVSQGLFESTKDGFLFFLYGSAILLAFWVLELMSFQNDLIWRYSVIYAIESQPQFGNYGLTDELDSLDTFSNGQFRFNAISRLVPLIPVPIIIAVIGLVIFEVLVLQRRFFDLVSFWPEIASRKARPQGCHGRGQVAMKRCSRSLSCEASL